MSKTLFVDAYNLTARLRHVYWDGGVIADGSDFRLVAKFLYSLTKMVDDMQPQRVVILADSENYIRTSFFESYKAQRSFCPIYHNHKILCVKVAQKTLPVSVVCIEGYEADDLISYYAEELQDDIVIVSTDGDLLQIVQRYPDRVTLYSPIKKSILPVEYPDVDYRLLKALMGDRSDNVPSVTGEKTAIKLLRGEMDMDQWLDSGVTRSEQLPRREVFERNLKIVSLYGENTVVDKPELPAISMNPPDFSKLERVCANKLNLSQWVRSNDFSYVVSSWKSWYGRRVALQRGVRLGGSKIRKEN